MHPKGYGGFTTLEGRQRRRPILWTAALVVAVWVLLIVLMPSGDATQTHTDTNPMDVVGLALHATCVVRDDAQGTW